MGRLEDEIRELIKDRYGSIPKLAAAINVPKQTIYSSLKSDFLGSSMSTVMPIVKALDIDPYLLIGGLVRPLDAVEPASVDVPLYGTITAGKPDEPGEIERNFPIPAELHKRYPHAFLLRVEGESMNRVLPNGCYALVDPCDEITHSRQIYALAIGGQAVTVKRVVLLENGIELQPDSSDPTFKSRLFDFGEPDSETVSVIGHVVWYCPPASYDVNAN